MRIISLLPSATEILCELGLEDNIYIEQGVLAPSNAALVEKAARIIHDLGGSVASAGQARELLSL